MFYVDGMKNQHYLMLIQHILLMYYVSNLNTIDEVIGAMDKRHLDNFHIKITYDSNTRRVTIAAGKKMGV